MRRSLLLSVAAASLIAGAYGARAATRPVYGGTLRMEVSGTLTSLDPLQDNVLAPESALRGRVASLLFDGLVQVDETGAAHPALATSWRHEPDLRRWQFVIRRGVKMHDGSRLSPRLVVMSLSAANGGWRVHLQGDDVVVESDSPIPNILAELSRPRYSVVGHGSDNSLVGTGPFRITEFVPGQKLTVKAFEDCWAGRPYADAIELTFARTYREQAIDLQLDRTDVIEVRVDQARRSAQEGERTVVSAPVELLAIVFAPRVQDQRVRQAISAAIDRTSIYNVLLQKQGEPASSLLPQWVSGYAFLFPTSRNEQRVQQLRAGLTAQILTLAYDASDPLAKAVAERVAVNARDAGVTVQASGENTVPRQPAADLRLVRITLASPQPAVALAALAAEMGHKELQQQLSAADSPELLYATERSLLGDFRVVPIAYLPEVHALSARVRNWVAPVKGGWALDEVSLVLEKP